MEMLQKLAAPAPLRGLQTVKTFEKTSHSNGHEQPFRVKSREESPVGGKNGYENYSLGLNLPDHTQLPAEDGTFVKNFQEHPQSILITDSIAPVLQELHPDGQYAIGQDSGIYWRLPEPPEKLEKGAEAPDWFYVPGVPPLLDGKIRRSYVMWQEHISPLVAMEFVSGDGREEKDQTPGVGKFWVYEQVIQPEYYAIYFVNPGKVELYRLVHGKYEQVAANEREHYPIESLGVELGIWSGVYKNAHLPWLRCWDSKGNLLLTGEERADLERFSKEQALKRAKAEYHRAEAERERAEAEQKRAEAEQKRAEAEQKRAEEQRKRAEAEQKRAEAERFEKELALKRAEKERQRAAEERQRAEAEQKRAEAEQKRAEAEQKRAEAERFEKELALKRAERLAAQLRALGIEPEEL